MTIDPRRLTDFNRSRSSMEEFALYATMLRTGHPLQVSRRLENLLANARLTFGTDLSPFEIVRTMVSNGSLELVLRRYETEHAIGLARCWTELTALKQAKNGGAAFHLADVNLHSMIELEQVFGIDTKLAHFIVTHAVKSYALKEAKVA